MYEQGDMDFDITTVLSFVNKSQFSNKMVFKKEVKLITLMLLY